MGNLSAFTQPQKLINWAQSALDNSYGAADAFFKSAKLATVIEEKPEIDRTVAKIKLVSPIPDSIEGEATTALNHARNAFDQMLFAACATIHKPIRQGHYPWVDTPGALDRHKFTDKKTGEETIPSEFWDTIRSQEPYPAGDGYQGGHTIERAVATLANRKHTVGLQVIGNVARLNLPNLSSGTVFGVERTEIMTPRWDPVKNELEFLRWKGSGRPQFRDDYQLAFQIIFDPSCPQALRSTDPFDALRLFVKYAQHCLDGFKARCTELGF